MRVLIYYASIGSGHLSAARAIEAALLDMHPEVEVILTDVFSNQGRSSGAPELLSALAASAFPGVYDWSWRTGSGRPVFQLSCSLPVLRKRVLDRFEQIQPDLVICTHVLPCAILSSERKRRPGVPIMAISTDFQANLFWPLKDIAAYVVATEDSARNLRQRGVPDGRVYPFGIPIVWQGLSTMEVGCSVARLSILVIAGGKRMGSYLPIQRLVYRLARQVAALPRLGIDWEFVLGSNRWMKRRLEEAIGHPHHLSLNGLVDDMHERMGRADLIVTKPGGLTLAEAFAAGKPVLLLAKGAGQEAANTRAVLSHRAGVLAQTPGEILAMIDRARKNPAFLERLRANAADLGKPGAARQTAELAWSMVG